MGDLYYIVRETGRVWEYVCYGKQRELYANRKELLAAFMFLESSHEFYYPDRFIKGSDGLEYYAMRAFDSTVDDWTNHVKDVSDEWFEYAEEELIS